MSLYDDENLWQLVIFQIHKSIKNCTLVACQPLKQKEILLKNSWQKENQNHHIVDKTPRLIDTVDKGKQIVHAWSQPVNVFRVYPWRWTRILHLLTHKGSLQATKSTSLREVDHVDVRCVLIASPCPNLATACVHHPGKTVRSRVHTTGTSDHTECHKISTLEAPASTSPSPAQCDLESSVFHNKKKR